MRAILIPLLLAVSALGGVIPSAAQAVPQKLSHAAKLIVVTSADWSAVSGTLTRYQRKHNKWERVGKPIPIVVGKTGLAWDPTLTVQRDPGDPVKHEGDGKSPAGVFGIPKTFGFAPSLGTSAMYITLTPTTECVDDTSSRYYTRVVDRLKVSDVDWNSSEKMRMVPGYQQGAIVDYNMETPVGGNGSCIFLHIWSGPGQGTVGCTAMAAEDMEQLSTWIESKGATALVQLPEKEYTRLKGAWKLP